MENFFERVRRTYDSQLFLNTRELPDLSHENQIDLLHMIIQYRSQRSFLAKYLKKFNVPLRTKLYKDLGLGSSYSEWHVRYANQGSLTLEDYRRNQIEVSLEEILRHTTIHQWLGAYAMEYPIINLLGVLEELYGSADALIDVPLIIRPYEQNT